MLGELEDAIQARLAQLKEQLPRLHLDSYGGELSDPDLLVDLLKMTPSVLITTPKVRFDPAGQRRFKAAVVFRLVISSTSVRGERETRRGTVARDPGSYWIWEQCMHLLTGWQHKEGGARVAPTEFANLVNGKFQTSHLSVLGQSFAIALDWVVPEFEPGTPDLEGVDMAFRVPADNPEPVAHDSVDLRGL
ncbi:phage protein Gp37 [Pseudomonas sp. GTC 16473]|uniref:phage protein Gp37 n=1 Tax=Pseudomonas sp. GTC 16473 TaxID=1661060 RepID=UPI0008636990|nr:phage protein Gp37 [Pseudomonas sp. GTC 16473]